jgi:hypothetical protein
VTTAPESIGEGRWPRISTSGPTTAVLWRRGAASVVRIHDGKTWTLPVDLEAAEAALAFDAGGALHVAADTGLWKLDGGRFDKIGSASFRQPSLAFAGSGPIVASVDGGKVIVSTADAPIDSGDRPSILAAADGTIHLAYRRGEKLLLRERREGWSEPKEIPVVDPSWPALALDADGVRVTCWGRAEHGPEALWLTRSADPAPVLVPSLAPNISETWMVLGFRLSSPRRSYRPHQVDVALNNIRVARFTDAVPEGRYFYRVEPYKILSSPRRPVNNRISVHTRHMNPGNYMTATDYTLITRLAWSERFGFARDEDEMRGAFGGRIVNHDRPDLALLSNDIELPVKAPPPGPIPLRVIVANLGESDAGPSRIRLADGGRALEEADAPALKPGEQRVVSFELPWDGKLESVVVSILDHRDFDPRNDTLEFRLWGGEPSWERRAPEPDVNKPVPTARLSLKMPKGMEEPDFEVRSAETGQDLVRVAGWSTPHAESYAVPHGALKLTFRSRVLSPVFLDLAAGTSRTIDLAAQLGLLKIVPPEGWRQPEFHLNKGPERVATVAWWDSKPAESYLIGPGNYRLEFRQGILTDLEIEMAAGRETILDLPKLCCGLRLVSGGGPYLGEFELDSGGRRVRTVAHWSSPPGDQYLLKPGSYRIEFTERFATPLEVNLQPGPLKVDLDREYGHLLLTPPAGIDSWEVLDPGGKRAFQMVPYAFKWEERVGIKAGSYSLRSERVPVPVPFAIEAGKDTAIRPGHELIEVTFEMPEKDRPNVEVLDGSGRSAGSFPGWKAAPRTVLYLPPGDWEIRFGRGFKPEKLQARPGQPLKVTPRPE